MRLREIMENPGPGNSPVYIQTVDATQVWSRHYPLRTIPPRLLFKYLSPQFAVDSIRSRLIRYSQPECLDDPLEAGPPREIARPLVGPYEGGNLLVVDVFDPEGVERNNEIIARRNELSRQGFSVSDHYIFVIESRGERGDTDFVALSDEYHGALEPKIRKYAIALCLTELSQDTRMWSDYGVGHTGIALGFASRHSYFRKNRDEPERAGFFGPIKYCPLTNDLIELLSPQERFLVKSSEWSGQAEWRRLESPKNANVTTTGADGQDIYLFQYPEDLLRLVLLGSRISEDIKASVVAAVEAIPEEHRPHIMQGSIAWGDPVRFDPL